MVTHLLSALVFMWLVSLAIYDVRHHSVPHIAWVGVPAFVATCLALWRGNDVLAISAVTVMLASERHHLPETWREGTLNFARVTVILCIALSNDLTRAGAVAVYAFWSCYEAEWWGGTDALTGITLLVWQPSWALLAWLCVGLVGVYLIARWHGRRDSIPALPAFALGLGLALTTSFLFPTA